MNFKLLCDELLSATPSINDLRSLGLSSEEIDEFVASFRIETRKDKVLIGEESDVVAHFFSDYDPSKVEVGMVRFLELPILRNAKWQIGQVESDPLIVDRVTGEVYVDDLTSPGLKLWICSDNFEHFLSALIPAAQYLGRCLIDASELDNHDSFNKFLNESVISAGGDRYVAFYKMLLGAK